jgi:hypothetical protein
MVFLEPFLDGLTSAGLFGKLRWPGAPTEFIDSRSVAEFDAHQAAMESLARLATSGALTTERMRPLTPAELQRASKS